VFSIAIGNRNEMNKGLHRFALLLACATFFLIIAGAQELATTPGWQL